MIALMEVGSPLSQRGPETDRRETAEEPPVEMP